MSVLAPWHQLEASLWQAETLFDFSLCLDRFLILNSEIIEIKADEPLLQTLAKYGKTLDAAYQFANEMLSSSEHDAFEYIRDDTKKARRAALSAVAKVESLIANLGDDKQNDKQHAHCKRPTINMQMAVILQKEEEAMGWNLRQWQQRLGCKSRSTIADSQTWKNLNNHRAQQKIERQGERRKANSRKPRHYSNY